MTIQAYTAIEAAKNAKNWGAYAARQFARKRGVTGRLYRIARQCEATQGTSLERRAI